jgi:hypothetical protein
MEESRVAKATRRKRPLPVLYKSIFQARYKPQLEFYKLLIPAARQFEDFPHWETDRLNITLFDFEKHCSVSIAHDSFSYHQDSEDVEQEQKYIKKVLDVFPTGLEIDTFRRFGLRRWYLIPVDIPLESLASILNIKLLSQDDRLRSIMPGQINDLSFIVVSSEEPYAYRAVIGPMRKAEIPSYITVDQKHHLNMKDRGEVYLELLRSYPEVSVYLEIDYYQLSENLTVEDAKKFIQAANERVNRIVYDLSRYFFSTEV